MRTKLILILIVVVGMIALKQVAQNAFKNIEQSTIEKSQPKR